jgi:hypothetical protein
MIDANMPPRPSLSLSAIGSPLRGHPCRPATGGGWSKPVRRASGLHQKRASAAFFPHLVLVFCLCPGFFPVLHAAGHESAAGWLQLERDQRTYRERVVPLDLREQRELSVIERQQRDALRGIEQRRRYGEQLDRRERRSGVTQPRPVPRRDVDGAAGRDYERQRLDRRLEQYRLPFGRRPP